MQSEIHITLGDNDYKRYLKIKKVIEAERELQPTDFDAIALLALNFGMLDAATAEIEADGYITTTVSKYGEAKKKNPAIEVMNSALVAIRSLMSELLMSPRAKATVKGMESGKVEENDPIADLIKSRLRK